MAKPLICLTLTGKTLEEDIALVNKYRNFIDIAELRADFLTADERLVVRRFPKLAGLPCILTLRRRVDGGQFIEGEAGRTILFARALSFADPNPIYNFAYVDFEEDFHVPSLQDAALAFGTKIIRSAHSVEGPFPDLAKKLEELKRTGFEIPKIAFTPNSLDDVTKMFEIAKKIKDDEHIFVAMGPLGVPSRILSARLKNFLTYTIPPEEEHNVSELCQIDPVTLNSLYNFRKLNSKTQLYGITGWPLKKTSSPELHNSAYKRKNMNAVYIPIRSDNIEKALNFADTLGMKGLSVTVPHKEAVMNYILQAEKKVEEIGAANTLVNIEGIWNAFNTDAEGFSQAILEATGLKSLKHKKITIIGAGGAARAIAYAVSQLRGKACILNRTVSKAQEIAGKYGFAYGQLNADSSLIIKKYNDIIIQTTSIGMNTPKDQLKSTEENDPLYFYNFTGKEFLFDIVYVPEQTPVMLRAIQAGCQVCNGYEMLKYQGYRQFKLYTGENY